LLSHFDISVVPIKPISEKEYPISFSPAMVQAIQENRKTQTRRIKKPPCKKGDLLWVQENYRLLKEDKCCDDNEYWCKYDDDTEKLVTLSTAELTKLKGRKTPHHKKQPGRFMYRSCSRILLEVTDVHSEQLQDISDEDAIAEGIEVTSYKNYVTEFKNLWESIYGIDSWLNNPLVWVIQFERLEMN
ncbi:MAG: ASCH domain-containing protein, partial [Dolichospermum sp.]